MADDPAVQPTPAAVVKTILPFGATATAPPSNPGAASGSSSVHPPASGVKRRKERPGLRATISVPSGPVAIAQAPGTSAAMVPSGRATNASGPPGWRQRTNGPAQIRTGSRSEEHTSELQSRGHLVCRLLL